MQLSKEQIKQAVELAQKYTVKTMFVNDKGEFFKLESDAKNSVAGNRERYVKVEAETKVFKTPDVPESKTEATNDTATVKEVNAFLDTCTDEASILKVVEAEQNGYNRKTILNYAKKKINELKSKD